MSFPDMIAIALSSLGYLSFIALTRGTPRAQPVPSPWDCRPSKGRFKAGRD